MKFKLGEKVRLIQSITNADLNSIGISLSNNKIRRPLIFKCERSMSFHSSKDSEVFDEDGMLWTIPIKWLEKIDQINYNHPNTNLFK